MTYSSSLLHDIHVVPSSPPPGLLRLPHFVCLIYPQALLSLLLKCLAYLDTYFNHHLHLLSRSLNGFLVGLSPTPKLQGSL